MITKESLPKENTICPQIGKLLISKHLGESRPWCGGWKLEQVQNETSYLLAVISLREYLVAITASH